MPLLLLALTGCPRLRGPEPEVTPTPAPVPTPTPAPYVPARRMEIGKMFNGMQVRTSLETEVGTTASADRAVPGNYALDIQVRVKVPKPHRDLAELTKLNAQLPTLLPGLPALLETGKVSPAFDELYRLKVANLQSALRARLDLLMSRQNFFDTETVLELTHPVSQRRALLVQSDMDTDTDGSDPDRVPEVEGASSTFQPFTSYKWPRKTTNPSAFIPPREAKVKALVGELAAAGLSAARKKEITTVQGELKGEISDLQKYSYLVANADPYIVLPGSMFGRGKSGPFAPAVGDYCVVIYGDTLYPAVVGDVGPTYKSGEGSLRICKQINPRADGNNSAASELKVTYLVFPGSADKPFDVPNLDKWRTRCDELLKDLGGYSGTLFAWEDTTKPKPPPAPPAPATPAPAVTPAPAAGSR